MKSIIPDQHSVNKVTKIMTRFSGIMLIVLFLFILIGTNHVYAAVSDWQKGISIIPHWNGDYDTDSFRQSLQNLKNTGATYVALIIPVYQADLHASDIYAGGDTPTDESLISAINYAHSIGLHVMLKPHLEVQNVTDWRAKIDPWDRDAWYRNYGNYLNHIGDIGKQTGVEGITMGTELISVASYTVHADNTDRWEKMIADMRSHYSGFLTYEANWSNGGDDFVDEIKHIAFWGSLDFIGVSAYYPIAGDQDSPSVDAMVGSWGYWDSSQLRGIHDTYGKPLLFAEVGYRSTNGDHKFPCCINWQGYNGAEQANDYEALFRYWNDSSYFAGVYFWNWDSDPNYGGEGNQDYTPHNKPAEEVLKQWFGTNSGGPISGGSSSGNSGGSQSSGSWTFNATIPSFNAGEMNTISVNAQNSGSATNVILDFEIYDSAGSKVLQKYFEGQTLSSGGNMIYNIPWTPANNGTYILKSGVFKSDWSSSFAWSDNVASINVGGGTSGGSNSGGTGGGDGNNDNGGVAAVTNIWWPGDGSSVSGTQPFKAMVANMSVSDYTMFWQVDGGQLNQMYDSQEDYPHKEAWVDVSTWKWNSNGDYRIKFVSKDSSGNVISEKEITVHVL